MRPTVTAAALPLPAANPDTARLAAGIAVGLLAALQFAPPSHAAVFPFAAMSIGGLLLLSGVDAASFAARALAGDAMFVAAGTLWAGFGILLRKHRLDPLLATAVVSVSTLLTYVPAYLALSGGARLLAVAPHTLWTEILVQGVIAGAGTLFICATMVKLLGPSRAAIFPALAPGFAALMAWPS